MDGMYGLHKQLRESRQCPHICNQPGAPAQRNQAILSAVCCTAMPYSQTSKWVWKKTISGVKGTMATWHATILPWQQKLLPKSRHKEGKGLNTEDQSEDVARANNNHRSI